MGICEICLRRSEKLFKCRMCGRLVCPQDYDAKKGLCASCLEAMCQLCGERLSIGYCEKCGRLVCSRCSTERGAALLCAACARGRDS